MARWLERHVGERVVEVAAQRLGAGCVAAHDHREDATAKVARIGPAREIEGLARPASLPRVEVGLWSRRRDSNSRRQPWQGNFGRVISVGSNGYGAGRCSWEQVGGVKW